MMTERRTTPSTRDATLPREGEEGLVYMAFNARKLRQLMACNAVRVEDFHCLDRSSKQRVWALCLQACAHALSFQARTHGAHRAGPQAAMGKMFVT